jgi:hypothetical protein
MSCVAYLGSLYLNAVWCKECFEKRNVFAGMRKLS